MGSDKSTGSKLAVRCCQGAYFAVGFVITTVTFAIMFWIVWCYFGIAIVHISDSQRRAGVVNHSYTTPKPQATPVTPAPRIDGSIPNSIAKSTPGTAVQNQGASRAQPSSVVVSNLSPSREKEKVVAAPILNRPLSDSSEEEGLNVRRVSTEVVDNSRPDTSPAKDESGSNVRRISSPPEKDSNKPNIEPTKVNEDSGRARKSEAVDKTTIDETKPAPRDYDDKDRDPPIRRDDIQPSRRAYQGPTYEDSNYPRRTYADEDDRGRPMSERGSTSRFDRRDRDRDDEERYPRQGTRIYGDDDASLEKERVRRPLDDDRYRDRVPVTDRSRTKDDRYIERYPEGAGRSSDDERYYRDRDSEDLRREDRWRVRGSDSKPRYDERRQDDKYIRREDRYHDDDRYDERYSEDGKYRRRDEDRLRPRDEDRYRPRDDDDDKYRYQDEERYRDRTKDERDRSFDSRKPPSIITGDKEEYISRSDSRVRDRDFRDSPLSGRSDLNRPLKDNKPIENSRVPDRDIRDRDRPYIREDVVPSRVDPLPRIAVPESRRKDRDDEHRKVTRYDAIDDKILPTKTRDEIYIPQSSASYSRSRNEERYFDDRDEIRRSDDTYYDMKGKVRNDDSGGSLVGTSRGVADTRDEYRPKIVDERRDEVVLDHRSYSSGNGDEYQRSRSRTRTPSETERSRRPQIDDRQGYDNSKRGYLEERPPRLSSVGDDVYERPRPRGDYAESRTRYQDRPDDEFRRYEKDDDRYTSRDDDRYSRRDEDKYLEEDRSTSTVRKYDRRPEDTDRARDPDRLTGGKDEFSRSDDRTLRPKPDRFDDVLPRADSRDPYISSENRRYGDVPSSQVSRVAKDAYEADPRTDSRRNLESSNARNPFVDPPKASSEYSRDSSRAFTREKRVTESSRTLRDEYYPGSREIEKDQPEDLVERPFSVKEVVETAMRQPDGERQNKKVFYPAFDPRVSNLTSPEIIRTSERKGTTITAKRRRRRTMEYIVQK